MEEAGTAIFALYENLLDKTALLKWNKIFHKQIGTSPWTNLNGKFHLLQVFSDDAAEQQKYYINIHLKKPAKVTILHFADPVEQLNSYLTHLPGHIDSPKAIPSTKRIKPFEEAELAQLILHTCHPKWQDQYNLNQGFIPQSLRSTIKILKNVEQFQESSKPPGKPNGKPGENGKSNGKKRNVGFKDKCVLKKNHTSKNCDLYKKHGGTHMTHNTADCNKYKKNRSIKPNFKKSGSHTGSKLNQNFTQVLNKGFAKKTKILKDKTPNKKRSIKDSDSDWLIGWGSTSESELVGKKRKKRKISILRFSRSD